MVRRLPLAAGLLTAALAGSFVTAASAQEERDYAAMKLMSYQILDPGKCVRKVAVLSREQVAEVDTVAARCTSCAPVIASIRTVQAKALACNGTKEAKR